MSDIFSSTFGPNGAALDASPEPGGAFCPDRSVRRAQTPERRPLLAGMSLAHLLLEQFNQSNQELHDPTSRGACGSAVLHHLTAAPDLSPSLVVP
jgi:hypothetical protein